MKRIENMSRDELARKLKGSKRSKHTYDFIETLIKYGCLEPTSERTVKGKQVILYTKNLGHIDVMVRSMVCWQPIRKRIKIWELPP